MNDYKSNLEVKMLLPENGHQIVEFHGDLDKAGLDENRAKLEKVIENFTGEHLIFDLSNLQYINSESIGFTMMIHSHLAKLGKSLIIVNAKPNVKDVFQVIGLFNVVPYYNSLNEAFTQLAS